MYLTSTNLVHYLLARGCATRHAVVHAPFSVFEIDGHHRSFRVVGGAGDGLFVKQLKSLDPASVACLRREACCYQFAWSDPALAPWQQHVPRLVCYDPVRHVVIVERIPDAEDFVQCHRRLQSFPLDLARLLATALANFHCSVRQATPVADDTFPIRVPWVFQFHRHGHAGDSPAVQKLAEAIRADDVLSRELESLQATWSTAELIHGDMKWGNCLVSPTANDAPRLHLVDWEMATWGDPLWDVAGALGGYLAEPLLKGDVYGVTDFAVLDRNVRGRHLTGVIQAFWQTYWQDQAASPDVVTERALRCVRFLAAQLLVTIVERHQHADALSSTCDSVLDASRQLLSDPRRSAAWLFEGATA